MAVRRQFHRSFTFDTELTRLCPDRSEREKLIACLPEIADKAEDGDSTVLSGELQKTFFQIRGNFVLGYTFDSTDVWFRIVVLKGLHVV